VATAAPGADNKNNTKEVCKVIEGKKVIDISKLTLGKIPLKKWPEAANIIITGLESLRTHCESMIDKNELDSIWQNDVHCLSAAIDIVKALI
jgi:hypothetical protein